MAPSSLITAISNDTQTAVRNPLELLAGDSIPLCVFGSNITQEYLERTEIKVYKDGQQITEIAGEWYVYPDGDMADIDIIENVTAEDVGNYVIMFAGKTITYNATVS